MTKLVQDLSVAIQGEFPAIIRLPRIGSGIIALATTAELEVAMMEEPGHHLFDTYRKKGKPANLKSKTPQMLDAQTHHALCQWPRSC